MLNQTSYHGAGAIAEIATEAKAHASGKHSYVPIRIWIEFGVTGKVTKSAGRKVLLMKFIPILRRTPPLTM